MQLKGLCPGTDNCFCFFFSICLNKRLNLVNNRPLSLDVRLRPLIDRHTAILQHECRPDVVGEIPSLRVAVHELYCWLSFCACDGGLNCIIIRTCLVAHWCYLFRAVHICVLPFRGRGSSCDPCSCIDYYYFTPGFFPEFVVDTKSASRGLGISSCRT